MRIHLSLLLVAFGLFACDGNIVSNDSVSSSNEHTYDEVSHLHIDWDDIFSILDEYYYVYVYSTHCGYCQKIKNPIIEFALSGNDNFYFVEFSNDVTVSTNVSNTIGASSIEDLSILGTPSLVVIQNHYVTDNMAGLEAICTFLDIDSS